MPRPGFITRQDLLLWADSVGAGTEFPRLLRRLILETGRNVTELLFPAGEGARVGGWDGSVRSTDATPFIPEGLSGWEVSGERKAGLKADKDYEQRTAAPDGSPTAQSTYVAVSLRLWSKRAEWAARRRAERRWKDVRAIGLDEIEGWLEAAPITQAWISEQRGLEPYGLRTVDAWWSNWSTQTNPILPPALMLAGRQDAVETLRSKLGGSPQTITINAQSRDEVLAFVSAFAYGEESAGNATILARTAFVDEVTAWRSLVSRDEPLVLVATSDDVVGDTGGRQTVHHVIVPVTRSSRSDIDLPPIDSTEAGKVLKAQLSEKDADDVARLARLNLLAARRRLAIKRELMRPTWAQPPVSRAVRRFLLTNRWSGAHETDRSVVARFLGQSYEDVVEDIALLSSGEDPLLATVDAAVNVVSPYDAYLQLVGELTTEDLTEFKALVLQVIGLENPALELPIDERWKASIYGKDRPHSSDLRQGFANSLALLGTLGERPVAGSTMTGANWAAWIVSDLLKQANASKQIALWASLDDVLPELAEAAPDALLAGVAEGLEGDPPLLQAIFIDNEAAGPFMSPTHTGLLWGLEICAWSPAHFGQAVDVLAGLAEIDPGGRWVNRPFHSLREIFMPWHPQNSVDQKRRLDVIDGLRQRHPSIAWRLMLALLPEAHGIAQPTHAPSYRDWKPAEAPVLMRDYWSFIGALIERLLDDVGDDVSRWVTLIPTLDDMSADFRKRLVTKLETVAEVGNLDEPSRAQIWDKLTELVSRHREFPDTEWALPESELEPLSQLAERFRPTAPDIVYVWLFDDHMPTIPGFRRSDDWDKYGAELARLRKEALVEIGEQASWDELLSFVRKAKVPGAVGIALSRANVGKYDTEIVTLLELTPSPELAFARGYLATEISKAPARLDALLDDASLSPHQRAQVVLSVWDVEREWALLAKESPEVIDAYWRGFPRFPGRIDAKQLATVVKGLRSVGRIGAALDLLAMDLPKEGDKDLAELAADSLQHFLDKGGEDQEAMPASYDFVRLFNFMDKSIPVDRVARLEWAYLTALEHSDRRFALHRLLADSPDFFVDLVSKVFRAREEGSDEDAEEGKEETPPDEATRTIARNGYRLLDSWKSLPGTSEGGQLDAQKLRAWVNRAREELTRLNRRGIGDDQIGKVLAHSPADADGIWPAVPVRDLVEELKSPDLEAGLRVEAYNQRGITSRGLESGGTQERDIAARYRTSADRLADRWPRSAALSRTMADSYEHDARGHDEDAERWRKGLQGPGSGPVKVPTQTKATETTLHFAYGSNMSTSRLEKRIGSVRAAGIGKLADHEIRFDKRSDDGSGKTDFVPAAGGEVWGVLFELTSSQLKTLRGFETGYVEVALPIQIGNAEKTASVFQATKTVIGLRPTPKYLGYLISGAREHGLPANYVAMLEKIEASPAPRRKKKT
jgi:hypothetical protein